MIFVEYPNCPKNASRVLVAKNTPKDIISGLKKLNIEVIIGGELPYSVKSVACHIDTQLAHLGGNVFVVSPHLAKYYKSILPEANIISGLSSSTGTYPDDASYNIASTGKINIHNFKYTDEIILSHIKGEKIQVSQGYSKCSVCIVDEKSFITEDEGIARTLKCHNKEVLLISPGDVTLPGLDRGFLGGASGKITENILAFAGDIKSHRDYKAIYDFCSARNVELISLSQGKVIDIGSIIPIAEKE